MKTLLRCLLLQRLRDGCDLREVLFRGANDEGIRRRVTDNTQSAITTSRAARTVDTLDRTSELLGISVTHFDQARRRKLREIRLIKLRDDRLDLAHVGRARGDNEIVRELIRARIHLLVQLLLHHNWLHRLTTWCRLRNDGCRLERFIDRGGNSTSVGMTQPNDAQLTRTVVLLVVEFCNQLANRGPLALFCGNHERVGAFIANDAHRLLRGRIGIECTATIEVSKRFLHATRFRRLERDELCDAL